MITISQAVSQILASKPFIQEALTDGIINYSALANFMQPEVEDILKKKVNTGAIVMSIRRYESSKGSELTKKLHKVIKRIGDIIVRSNLIDYTFKNSETLLEKQQKLLKQISKRTDFFYTISQGVYETTFVLGNEIRDEIPLIFEGEKLVTYSSGLSSITIKLPAENTNQPGLYYFIFRYLAWEGVNILDVVSTANEFTLVLDDENIDKAFSVIKRIKNSG
ncbi:MAG: aspartate kinase [Bacteroidales bacterium]|nr:aspartate kinase [Bacteroidales bacterium]